MESEHHALDDGESNRRLDEILRSMESEHHALDDGESNQRLDEILNMVADFLGTDPSIPEYGRRYTMLCDSITVLAPLANVEATLPTLITNPQDSEIRRSSSPLRISKPGTAEQPVANGEATLPTSITIPQDSEVRRGSSPSRITKPGTVELSDSAILSSPSNDDVLPPNSYATMPLEGYVGKSESTPQDSNKRKRRKKEYDIPVMNYSRSVSGSQEQTTKYVTNLRLSPEAASCGADISDALKKLRESPDVACRKALRPKKKVNPIEYIQKFFDSSSVLHLKSSLQEIHSVNVDSRFNFTEPWAEPIDFSPHGHSDPPVLANFLMFSFKFRRLAMFTQLAEIAVYEAMANAARAYKNIQAESCKEGSEMWNYIQKAKSEKLVTEKKIPSVKNSTYLRELILFRRYGIRKDALNAVLYDKLNKTFDNEIALGNTILALIEVCGGTGILALIPPKSMNCLRSLGLKTLSVIFRNLLEYYPDIAKLCSLATKNLTGPFLSESPLPVLRLETTEELSDVYLVDLFKQSRSDTSPSIKKQLMLVRQKRKAPEVSSESRKLRRTGQILDNGHDVSDKENGVQGSNEDDGGQDANEDQEQERGVVALPEDDRYTDTAVESSSESTESSPDWPGDRTSKSRSNSDSTVLKGPLKGNRLIDKRNNEALYDEGHSRQNSEVASDKRDEGVVGEETDEEVDSMNNDKQQASGSQKRKGRELSGGPRKRRQIGQTLVNGNDLNEEKNGVQDSIEDDENQDADEDEEQETDEDTGAGNGFESAERSLVRTGKRTRKSRSNSTSTVSSGNTFGDEDHGRVKSQVAGGESVEGVSGEKRDGKSNNIKDVTSDLSNAVHLEHGAEGQIPADHDMASEERPNEVNKASASMNDDTLDADHVVHGAESHAPHHYDVASDNISKEVDDGGEKEVPVNTDNTSGPVNTEDGVNDNSQTIPNAASDG